MTSNARVAFITGVTGQDGSYLAEFLLDKGYEVHGLVRRSTTEEGSNYQNIKSIQEKICIHYGDILDMGCLIDILNRCQPTEIYNLAGQSHVTLSFTIPDYTFQVNQGGCLNLLQAIVHCNLQSKTRLYQASTSELFRGDAICPLNETWPFEPRSPYAISKLSAFWLVRNYREAHGIFAVNGIAFNHESPRRSRRFVTKRIACGLAEYVLYRKSFTLANVDSYRDWGHAKDYVRGMWLMLQHKSPQDFVLATGVAHSVQGFLTAACEHLGIILSWEVSGDQLKAIDSRDSSTVLELDRGLRRPTEVHRLTGDVTKAKELLNWESKIQFKELVREMVDSEMHRLKTTNMTPDSIERSWSSDSKN